MAIPRVFISSTCYDLKHIRENLKYFVRTVGYEPVLSDEGDVYYNPASHTHDSCLKEVETCQIFILIIGGRYGGVFKDGDSSVTNAEYREAVKSNIPVFALVESSVHSDHHLYSVNKNEKPDIADKITYPSIDNIKIFEFIDEVRRNSENNALFDFKDFSDMEAYLKKQWAGMMYDFIVQQSNEKSSKITNRLLDDLSLATKKSEELIKVLLKSTNSEGADDKIKEVDNRVEALNFSRLILEKFKMDRLYNTAIEDIEVIDLNKSWVDFLCETRDFHTEKMDDDEKIDLVLWGTASCGISIGKYKEGKFIPFTHAKIEQAYAALKQVDVSTRTEVFHKLVDDF